MTGGSASSSSGMSRVIDILYSVSDMSAAIAVVRSSLQRSHTAQKPLHTCDFLWEYRVEDLPFLNLLFASHGEFGGCGRSLVFLGFLGLQWMGWTSEMGPLEVSTFKRGAAKSHVPLVGLTGPRQLQDSPPGRNRDLVVGAQKKNQPGQGAEFLSGPWLRCASPIAILLPRL